MRSANDLENLHREFGSRATRQATFATEEASLTLARGLIALGQIQPREVDGYCALAGFLADDASTPAA